MRNYSIKFLSFCLLVIVFSSYSQMDYKDASKRIMSYIQSGQYDLAIAEADKVINNGSNEKATYFAYVLKGGACVYKKNYYLALKAYEDAIRINPNLPNAYDGCVYANWGLKNYDEAWKDVLKVESFGEMVNPRMIERLKIDSGKSFGITVEPRMMPSFTSLEKSRMPVASYIRKISSIMESQEPLLAEKTKDLLATTLLFNTTQRSSEALEARLALRQTQEEVMALPVPVPCKNLYYLTVNWLQLYIAMYNQIENSNIEEAKRIYQKIQVASKQNTDELKSLVNQYAKK